LGARRKKRGKRYRVYTITVRKRNTIYRQADRRLVHVLSMVVETSRGTGGGCSGRAACNGGHTTEKKKILNTWAPDEPGEDVAARRKDLRGHLNFLGG